VVLYKARKAEMRSLNLKISSRVFIALLSINILQYSIYLIHNNTLDKSIKAASLILLLLSIKKLKLLKEHMKILFKYFALFGSALLGALAALDMIGIIQLGKIVFMFLVFPVIILAFSTKKNLPGILLKMPLLWGVIFSIQSIILWLIIFFAIPVKSERIELGSQNNMKETSFGLLGYANALETYSESKYNILRPQGWFLEPSLLASFLIYPVFVSFGYYKSNNKKRYLLISLICLICMVLTFSLAGFFAVLSAIVFLVFIRPVSIRKENNKITIKKLAYPLIAAIGFVILAQIFMSYLQKMYDPSTYSATAYTKLLARDPQGPTGSLFRETYKLPIYIDTIKNNFFGIGLGHTAQENDKTSANALFYWLISGGVPAIIILCMLYFILFFSYCIPLMQSRQILYRFIGAAFVGMTVHGLGYGNWMNPYYLYVVAVMILSATFIKGQQRLNINKEVEKKSNTNCFDESDRKRGFDNSLI
jgi:hypothetical protein